MTHTFILCISSDTTLIHINIRKNFDQESPSNVDRERVLKHLAGAKGGNATKRNADIDS